MHIHFFNNQEKRKNTTTQPRSSTAQRRSCLTISKNRAEEECRRSQTSSRQMASCQGFHRCSWIAEQPHSKIQFPPKLSGQKEDRGDITDFLTFSSPQSRLSFSCPDYVLYYCLLTLSLPPPLYNDSLHVSLLSQPNLSSYIIFLCPIHLLLAQLLLLSADASSSQLSTLRLVLQFKHIRKPSQHNKSINRAAVIHLCSKLHCPASRLIGSKMQLSQLLSWLVN